MFDLVETNIRGTQVAYYVVCKRKLWLFSHHIGMESESDYVDLGKLISNESFKREKWKEVEIGETLRIDFLKIGDEIVVHEVKKSRALEEAHIWQVKFYIYSLRKFGIKSSTGLIHYPKLMRKVEVNFNEEDHKSIENLLAEIEKIVKGGLPPGINAPYCRKCAYFEFCIV